MHTSSQLQTGNSICCHAWPIQLPARTNAIAVVQAGATKSQTQMVNNTVEQIPGNICPTPVLHMPIPWLHTNCSHMATRSLNLHTSISDIIFWIPKVFTEESKNLLREKWEESKDFMEHALMITPHIPAEETEAFLLCIHLMQYVQLLGATACFTHTKALLQQVSYLETYFRNGWFAECCWPRSVER